MLELNQAAPNFTLTNHKKEAIELEAQRGKNVVIAFFPAAFTGVCEKEMCTLRDGLAELNNADATVLGVSVDGPFSNAAFHAKNDLNFDLLSDHSRAATTAYGVALENFAGMEGYTAAQRSVFIVDKKGTLVYSWVAPNPGVEPDYDEVKGTVAKLS